MNIRVILYRDDWGKVIGQWEGIAATKEKLGGTQTLCVWYEGERYAYEIHVPIPPPPKHRDIWDLW